MTLYLGSSHCILLHFIVSLVALTPDSSALWFVHCVLPSGRPFSCPIRRRSLIACMCRAVEWFVRMACVCFFSRFLLYSLVCFFFVLFFFCFAFLSISSLFSRMLLFRIFFPLDLFLFCLYISWIDAICKTLRGIDAQAKNIDVNYQVYYFFFSLSFYLAWYFCFLFSVVFLWALHKYSSRSLKPLLDNDVFYEREQ